MKWFQNMFGYLWLIFFYANIHDSKQCHFGGAAYNTA